MIIQDHGQPRPGRPLGLVEHHHIQLGVIGLPQIIRTPRFATKHQFKGIPVHGPVVVGQRQQPAIQTGDNLPHQRVRRRFPAPLRSDHAGRPVNLRYPGRRPSQRQALDHCDQLGRYSPTLAI